jgi:chromosome segregation ATPase
VSLPFFSSVADNRKLNPGYFNAEESRMTCDEMERAIQVLIEHHARVSTDIEGLKEAQQRTTVNIEALTRTVGELAESVSRIGAQAESDRQEMRDAIDKLILSNEVTRDLANQIGHLAVATSQRVTALEGRLP